MSKKQFAIYN